MDNNTIIDILFKAKNKKVSSTLTKLFFEESRVDDEMLNPNRIASDASSIPSIPPTDGGGLPTGIVGLIDYHSDILLMEDVSVSGKRSWDTNSLKNFINPSYGVGYEVKLYDDDGAGNKGNRIFASDPSDWYFFYNSGQLTFFGDNSSHNATSNYGYHIEVYQYIGNFGAGTGGGLNSSVEINQVAHGLSVGDLIYRDPTTPDYQKGIADGIVPEQSDVVGVVKDVIDADNFIYQYLIGEFVNSGSGFPAGTEGDAIFLSDIIPGQMTNISPSTLGHISKPIGIIIKANTKMILFQMRGIEVTLSGGGTPLTGGIEYDYYVTEDDFSDLRSALSNNTYLSVFVPNGTYLAPSGLVGSAALSITNSKLVHGETRDGVIIDLRNIDDADSVYIGLSVSDDKAVVENLTIERLIVHKNVDIHGIRGVSYFSCNNIYVNNIHNLTASYKGIGISKIKKSSKIKIIATSDIDIEDSSEIFMLEASKINGVKNISFLDITGYSNSIIQNSNLITNVYSSYSGSTNIDIDSCNGVDNLFLNYGNGRITNSINLSNFKLDLKGGRGRDSIIYNCENLTNFYITGNTALSGVLPFIQPHDDYVMDNCKNLNNISIISDISTPRIIRGIKRIDGGNNITINNCEFNPIEDSLNINNLHLENNFNGLTADDDTQGHLNNCKNVNNVLISARDLSNCSQVSTYLTNGVYSCENINNIELLGFGKYKDEEGSLNHVKNSKNISNSIMKGSKYASFYNCQDIKNSYIKNSYINEIADNNHAFFESCSGISNVIFERASIDNKYISGFYQCKNISNLNMNLQETDNYNYKVYYLFNNCKNIYNIFLENIVIGFNNCDNVENIETSGSLYEVISNSYNIVNSIFTDCGTDLDDNTVGIIENTTKILNCVVTATASSTGVYKAYHQCSKITNCDSFNSGTSIYNGFSNCEQLNNCSSSNSKEDGFSNCL